MLKVIQQARVRNTTTRVHFIQRGTITADQEIMTLLERAGAYVIGTPGGGFRFRKEGHRRFTHPTPGAVFLLDETGTRVTSVVPAEYFAAHYEVI